MSVFTKRTDVRWMLLFLFLVTLIFAGLTSCGRSTFGDDDDDDDPFAGDDDDDADDDDNWDDDDYWDDDDATDDDDDYWDDDDASNDDDDYWDDDDDTTDDDDDQLDCPDDTSDQVLFLSADDSNSQASPVEARAAINAGYIVSKSRIRTYEFTNYYAINYTPPLIGNLKVYPQMIQRANSDFTLEYVLQIGVQAEYVSNANRRNINLVLSLDRSGSMSGRPISLLKDTCRAIAGKLKVGDVVSMVEWDSSTSVILNSHTVAGPNDPTLLARIDSITSGGSTDLHGGLVRAYELAENNYDSNKMNRVVIISDGEANTGVTDINLIAEAAEDSQGGGIYLVGVGVGYFTHYNDELMDGMTDAGKGAYVFIDSTEEAERQFSDHFIQNLEIAAMDVQVRLTLPWYLLMHEYHGEEYSPNPGDVEPQHLAPNDAMIFHQYLVPCDTDHMDVNDTIEVRANYIDPVSMLPEHDSVAMAISDMLAGDISELIKGDAIVAYAEALKVVADKYNTEPFAALDAVDAARVQVNQAYQTLTDGELLEIRGLLDTLRNSLQRYM